MHQTRGYKYEFHLNNKERTQLTQCAGISRFAWNWGLAERLRRYKEHTGTDRYTDAMKQHKLLNKRKKTEFEWMYEVSKCIPQETLRDLEQAFQNFYRERKQAKATKKKSRIGFPKFKKKYKAKDSFRLTGTIKLFPQTKRVQLPRLGQLRLKEKPVLPVSARILSATVSRTADRWFFALTVEEEWKKGLPAPVKDYKTALGLDAGLARVATLSSGLPVPKPKFLLKRLKKLRRLSKAHSRKKSGSNNRRKSAETLAKFHAKVANTRKDFQHKLSSILVKSHDVLVVEDLSVKGLIRNKNQAHHWADLAHGEFCRMLTYKSAKYGKLLFKANRWFPSSKLCSNCLMYHPNLTLNDRIYCCPFCGLTIDRDYNAALNLRQYFEIFILPQVACDISVPESSAETLNACGEAVSPGNFQARLCESGKTAPKPTRNKCP